MGYAALVLAMIGFAIGTRFRIQVLLPVLVLLLLVSIAMSVARGFSILEAALTVILAQTIVQCSYFAGLLAHSILSGIGRKPRVGQEMAYRKIRMK
jgi:hypothetical protein